MEIRKAMKEDYTGMVDVEKSSVALFKTVFTDDECNQMMIGLITEDDFINGDERIIHYVSLIDDSVSGYVSFYIKDESTLWITNIYAHSDYRGSNIGLSLLAFVEEFAAKEGLAAVSLETQKQMTWAIDFYKKNNYKLVDQDNLSFVFTKELK
jgi:ribosomal protein S18 acetylase RimI-like enzyme